MSGVAEREATISVRLLWPFVVAGVDPSILEPFQAAGFALGDFVHPNARLPRQMAMEALDLYVRRTGDLTVGLRAGAAVDSAEFEPLEHAAHCAVDLRGAIELFARHVRLLNEALEISLIEIDDRAACQFRTKDRFRMPAANDFVLACAYTFARRRAGLREPPLEVHVAHRRPKYAVAYDEIFRTRVRFGMPHNTLVLRRQALERKIAHSVPALREALEDRLHKLARAPKSGLAGVVADLVAAQLPGSGPCMSSIARALGMSVATLRRKLDRKGTTFDRIVDETRRASAETLLVDSRTAIRDIAVRLGFAHTPAFYAAFRRWTGSTPAIYRAERAAIRRGTSRAHSPGTIICA